MPCAICGRQAKGFLWQAPKTRDHGPREIRRFCSFRCQSLHANLQSTQEQRLRWPQEAEVPMIDATETEKDAMAAALRPLGDYVTSLGLERPLAEYSREEILLLIEIVVDAFQAHLLEAHERQAELETEHFRHLEQRRKSQTSTGVPF